MNNPLIVICGPTASGKTSISIELAKALDGEIVSADSVQVYKGLNIGSAKPSPKELSEVPHHMIDIIDPWISFSAADFVNASLESILKIQKKGKTPIVCGGTGFYLHSLLYNLDFAETAPDYDFRNALSFLSTDDLYEKLIALDPNTRIHPNDRKRVIRSIEILSQGKTPQTFRNDPKRFSFLQFCLTWNRETLYKRINKRCDEMFLNDLIGEVDNLLKNPMIHPDLLSMQSIGYSQVCKYLSGEISLDTCIEDIKQKTRRFAKRQLTWFRHEKDCIQIDCDSLCSFEEVSTKIQRIIKNNRKG